MNDFEQEELLIRDMIEYLENNEYDSNNLEIKEKLVEYISKLCELETRKMGYKLKTYVYEDKFEEIIKKEDKGILNLFFYERIDDSEDFGFYGRKTAKEYVTKARAPFIIITDYGIDWMFKFAKSNTVIACALIAQNLLHELRHMRQDLMARTGVSSNIGLMYAKEYFLTERFYNSSIIERDANIESIKFIRKILDVNFRREHSFICTIDGTKMQIEEYISNIFDKMITNSENQYILQIYPVLKKEYNNDGTRKPTQELINNMRLEVNDISQENVLSAYDKKELVDDCKEMYFEIIYRNLTKATKEEIIDLLRQDGVKDLFEEMKIYFNMKCKKEQADTRAYVYFEEDGGIDEEINLRKEYYKNRIDFFDNILQDGEILNKLTVNTIKSNERNNITYNEL